MDEKKLKVVHVATTNVPYLVQLANVLCEDVETIIAIPEGEYEKYQKVISDQVNVITYPWVSRHLHFKNLLSALRLTEAIRKAGPDIVHTQNGGNSWFFFTYLLLRKVKFAITIHDPINHLGEIKAWKEYLFKLLYSDHYNKSYFVNGTKLRRLLAEKFSLSEERIVPITRGDYSIFLPFQTNMEVEQEPRTILFFGRIWEYKGLEYLIKAQESITSRVPDARIVIAGRGEDFDRYRAMMKDPSRFEIHNKYIPLEETIEFFKRSTVVVLPYVDASTSGVIPLAFSCHRPVIATDVGTNSDLVIDNETGFLIPPRDSEAIADSVVRLLTDPDLQQTMKTEIATRLNSDDLKWITAANQTLEAYKNIIEKN